MKRSLKQILAVVAVMVMSMVMVSCSSDKEADKKPEAKPEVVKTQEFTTKDGTYKITAGEEWKECEPYQNSESSLEIEIGGGITLLQVVKQTKSGLGHDLNSFNKEVVGYFTGNTALGTSTVESTEKVKCGNYDAVKDLIVTDEKSSGMKMFTCHLSIETDKDFMQLIIISTESNRDKVIKYADEISKTITPL